MFVITKRLPHDLTRDAKVHCNKIPTLFSLLLTLTVNQRHIPVDCKHTQHNDIITLRYSIKVTVGLPLYVICFVKNRFLLPFQNRK